MSFNIINGSLDKTAIQEVIKSNKVSSKFGLTLSKEQAIEIVQTRSKSLKASGRLEFGGGTIEKIIFEFCDSSYINQNEYSDIINSIVELFYQFKNLVNDKLSDDELIEFMREGFDRSDGSIELLEGRELEVLLEKIEGGKYD